MHELAIAEAVAGIATEHATGRRVERVELRVGHLRQVVPSALAFAWELATRDTPAEGSELAVEEVPARGCCRACGAEGRFRSFPLACESCGGFDLEIVSGEELLVDALVLVDEAATPEEVRGGG